MSKAGACLEDEQDGGRGKESLRYERMLVRCTLGCWDFRPGRVVARMVAEETRASRVET